MRKFLLFVFVVLCNQNIVFACSCLPGYSFCHTATYLENDLIVTGEITYIDTTKARLSIIHIFKGTEPNDTITIWAGTGHDCNGWISMATDFGEEGDTIVIILPRITSANIENVWDVVGDYRRPERLCLTPVLAVNGEYITSHHMGGDGINSFPGPPYWHVYTMLYSDFLLLWDNETIDCSTLIGIEEKGHLQPLNLFPNPAGDKINVELPPGAGVIKAVSMMDVAGRTSLVPRPSSPFTVIDISHLPPGIYFVVVETEKGVFRQKLVKK